MSIEEKELIWKNKVNALSNQECNYGEEAFQVKTTTADQEAWIKQRILTAIKMGVAIGKIGKTGAAMPLFECGIRGIAEGCAIEVIETLNMHPGFVNLKDYRDVNSSKGLKGTPNA